MAFSWEFISENGDVAYRICRTIQDNKGAALTELVVPLERVESHMFLEKGQIICDVAGSCNFFLLSLLLFSDSIILII